MSGVWNQRKLIQREKLCPYPIKKLNWLVLQSLGNFKLQSIRAIPVYSICKGEDQVQSCTKKRCKNKITLNVFVCMQSIVRNKSAILPCFGMHIWMVYIGASALPLFFLSIALGSPPHIIGWLKPPEWMKCYYSVGKEHD